MGLRNITIQRTTVTYNGEPIAVRGLSASDIMTAARDYAPQMALAFNEVVSNGQIGDMKSAIMKVADEFPELVAAAIALASDEYDDESVKTAGQLPFPTQLELVEGIFNETFTSEAEVKKLIESLTRMMLAASGALTEINGSDLLTGIGELGDKPLS